MKAIEVKVFPRKFMQRPHESVRDMEGELLAVRGLVDDIKKVKNFNQAPEEVKEAVRKLFSLTSGKYSFEADYEDR